MGCRLRRLPRFPEEFDFLFPVVKFHIKVFNPKQPFPKRPFRNCKYKIRFRYFKFFNVLDSVGACLEGHDKDGSHKEDKEDHVQEDVGKSCLDGEAKAALPCKIEKLAIVVDQ